MSKTKKSIRCGTVAIVGRPNVGKSTLLNKMVGEKVAIVSKVPQTTRHPVRGIYNDERGQIIFVDTPGIHKGRDRLDAFMNTSASQTTKEVDCIVHLVDANDPVGQEEEVIVKQLAKLNIPIILGLNKIDLKGRHVPEYLSLWEEIKGKPVTRMSRFTLLPLSGKNGIHIEKLLDILFDYLPCGPALYPTDTVCDIPQRMVIADIIREKLYLTMRHELPHALAVVIESMEARRGKILHIRSLILVEKESQRMIVIGKKGDILKKTGTLARQELEELLEKKVFLEMFVKVRRHWRDDSSLLFEMGYQPL